MKNLLNETHNEVYLANTSFEEYGHVWSEIYLDLDDGEDIISRIGN